MDVETHAMYSPPLPLIVDLARFFGGAEVRVLEVATTLGPERCQVACLRGSPLAGRLRAAGLQPLEMASAKTSPRIALDLARATRAGGYNVWDAHNVQSYLWEWLCSLLLDPRPALVATVHSSTRLEQAGPGGNRVKGIAYELVSRAALSHVDRVVAVSDCLCGEMRAWDIRPERISFVANGVRVERAAEGEREAVRRELGLAAGEPLIGTVGRLEPAKGITYLLQAVELLLVTWPRLRCLIAGEGRLLPELSEFVARHGLQEHVILAGFRTDVARLLEAMDVFVLPSITEGIPLALLEACVCARPIVASRVGGIPEVIRDGQSGWLVSAGDVVGLARAIDALLRDRALAERLGRLAAAEVPARYSTQQMVSATWQAYEEALAGRRRVRS